MPLTDYEACRLLRHAWEPCAPPPDYRGSFRYVLHLVCTRCGTTRADAVSTYGHLVHRAYRWPLDYGHTADTRPSPDDLRLVAVGARRTARVSGPAARGDRGATRRGGASLASGGQS